MLVRLYKDTSPDWEKLEKTVIEVEGKVEKSFFFLWKMEASD